MIRVRCPICNRALPALAKEAGQALKEWPEWPFCSVRCRQVDLGRWLGEAYRLDSRPVDTDLESDDSPKPAVPSAAPDTEEA